MRHTATKILNLSIYSHMKDQLRVTISTINYLSIRIDVWVPLAIICGSQEHNVTTGFMHEQISAYFYKQCLTIHKCYHMTSKIFKVFEISKIRTIGDLEHFEIVKNRQSNMRMAGGEGKKRLNKTKRNKT